MVRQNLVTGDRTPVLDSGANRLNAASLATDFTLMRGFVDVNHYPFYYPLLEILPLLEPGGPGTGTDAFDLSG
jgi:hypothetical protein